MNGTIFVSPLKTLHVSNFLSSYYSTATTKNAFVDLYENAINFNADSKTNELKQSSIIITFEYTSAWNNTPTSNDSLKYFSMSPLILLPSESQKMKKLQTNLLIAQCFVAVSHPWYITYFHDFIHQAIITTSPSPSSSLSSSSSSFTYTSLFSDFVKWLILTTVNKTTSDSITVVSYPDLRTSTTHSSNNNTSCDNEIELSNTHWKGKRRRKKMSLRKFWTNQVNLQLHIVFGYTHLRQWCITSDLQWYKQVF